MLHSKSTLNPFLDYSTNKTEEIHVAFFPIDDSGEKRDSPVLHLTQFTQLFYWIQEMTLDLNS